MLKNGAYVTCAPCSIPSALFAQFDLTKHIATVFRLRRIVRAVSDLGRRSLPSAAYHSLRSGARPSSPSFPGGLAEAAAREDHTAGAAPPVPGARPL